MLRFTSPDLVPSGTLAEMLTTCYEPLVSSDPKLWGPEVKEWERFDQDVYSNPTTVGNCTFITWWELKAIGFGSFDPRPGPEHGIIGHNCILPEYQRRGAGKAQIYEVLRRFKLREIQSARVSTLDHPFFHPARRMYLACGFQAFERRPWPASSNFMELHFGRQLEDSS